MPIIDIPTEVVPEGCFLDQIPKAPTGRYAHLIVVRETESFPVFQTDGTLNITKVSAGLHSDNLLIRPAMFKRKQTSPERLTGRELLRRMNITQNEDSDGDDYCDYNENFCGTCPDCVYYGFAIGDSGSEKSKVYVDTACSITGYDESHQRRLVLGAIGKFLPAAKDDPVARVECGPPAVEVGEVIGRNGVATAPFEIFRDNK